MDETQEPQLNDQNRARPFNFVPDNTNEAASFETTSDPTDTSGWTEEEQELDTGTYSWNASEFIHHQKKSSWYWLLAVAVVVLVAIAILTKQILSIMVFIAMGGAVAVYANKEPRVLNYTLNKDGISVGDKLYHYNKFRSFSVFNDVAWHSIDLDPLQRFQTRLTLMFDSNDLPKIEGLLSKHLPRIDRQPDIIERLTRTLKF